MKDTEIIDLYWARDERAIVETQAVYGKYCYSIALPYLNDREDSDKWRKTTPGFGHGTL